MSSEAMSQRELGAFLEKGKALADEAEEKFDELAGWRIHYAVLRIARGYGLDDIEALGLMGYEDEEPTTGETRAETYVPLTEEEHRELAKYLRGLDSEVRRSHAEAAELRERVEKLERALRCAKGYMEYWPSAEKYVAEIDAALSQANAHAEPETRSEEEEQDEK